MEMDREFWEEAREKPAVCWGVGREGEPCEACRKRSNKKGQIGCGSDCACGCAMSGAALGLHTKSEQDRALGLALKAYTHARSEGTAEARAWALGYLQAIVHLAGQEGASRLATEVAKMAQQL